MRTTRHCNSRLYFLDKSITSLKKWYNNEPAPHLHLLSSFESGWDGLNLIYELEPADEMPETDLEHHFIMIAENDFRASFMFNGSGQHVDYARGDIAIIPATQTFPR